MSKVELLAPAGSMEALKAAIISGADAIYLGGSHFGARSYAKNFDNEEISEAIKLAHLYQVKIYVTINTLIYDNEFTEVMNYIDFLYHHDVDALIIQDLGLMSVIRKYYPDLELHASTQMTIHNASGAQLLKENGIKRVVLARENTLEEIRKITENVSIETEVFVHGALCVSYSGQCLMSSLIGGRSGNRGKCAQPCRKLYDLKLNDEIIEKNKYLISPKDLNTINHLGEIIETGVHSLKIEGRMKSPEYVAIVVSIYRKAIDSYYKNKQINISASDLGDLEQIFNRQFTRGFMFLENGKSYINTEKNNNTGVLCGVVQASQYNKVVVKCLKPIHLNDGIYFEGTNTGLSISKMIRKGKVIQDAIENDLITLDVQKEIKIGVHVYKTTDVLLDAKARNIQMPKIPLNGEITLLIGQNPKIKLIDDLKNEVEVEINYSIEKSRGQGLNEDKIYSQLHKLGNTNFYWEYLKVIKDDDLFMIISSLNELRRKGIEQLMLLRQKKHVRTERQIYKYQMMRKTEPMINPILSVYCHNALQVKAALQCGIEKIYVNEDIIQDVKSDIDLFLAKGRIEPNPYIKNWGKGVLISELGSLHLAKDYPNEVITNFNLNVTNSETIKFLKSQNVSSVTLSYEMNEKAFHHLLYGDKSSLEVIVYGFQESMITKYCFFHDKCQKQCQKSDYYLIDSLKEKFLVTMDNTCHMHIHNSKLLILTDELAKLMKYGYKQFRLQFTKEDFNETVSVIHAYQSYLFEQDEQLLKIILTQYKKNNLFTRGYFSKDIL